MVVKLVAFFSVYNSNIFMVAIYIHSGDIEHIPSCAIFSIPIFSFGSVLAVDTTNMGLTPVQLFRRTVVILIIKLQEILINMS